MANCKIHIGQLIREQVRQQGRHITWFANRMGCSRNNIYNIFQSEGIDTEQLMRISLILNYNFFAVYQQAYKEDKGQSAYVKKRPVKKA